jgi:polycomb protein EED
LAERKAREKGKGKLDEQEKGKEAREPQPLTGRMARLGPGQGLGCEAAEGSLTPSKSREYKLCSKHAEGKRPLYAIGFNFIDARYYDVFATVGGNRVSLLYLFSGSLNP